MRDHDRVIMLKPLKGKQTNNHGMVDTRLFSGDNKLHAIMDHQTSLWYLKYEKGALPDPLKQHFTGFSKLMNYVTEYFKRRNIEVIEVLD